MQICHTCIILNHFLDFLTSYKNPKLSRSQSLLKCLLTINGSNNCHWNHWNKSHSSSLITLKMSVRVCVEGQRLDMPFAPADTEQLWAAYFNLVTCLGSTDSWDILGISQAIISVSRREMMEHNWHGNTPNASGATLARGLTGTLRNGVREETEA